MNDRIALFSEVHKQWLASDQLSAENLQKIAEEKIECAMDRQRFLDEFLNLGPIAQLWSDENVTEILVNGPDSIWVERRGVLERVQDRFISANSYLQFLERVIHEAGEELTVQAPFIESRFRQARLTVIGSQLTRSNDVVSFRRTALVPWTLERLFQQQWCTQEQLCFLRNLIRTRANFFVVGSTGVGKTSLLSAMLAETHENERSLIIEDTEEIVSPNAVSLRLLTRPSVHSNLREFTQTDLIQRSLRLRPDRLVLGEVRGPEAKDLLMALSCGHSGSFGSVHAQDPHQALYRLETLVQMGAPQWSLQTVRRLIQLGLHYVLVVKKDANGRRFFDGAYKLCSLEEYGFCLEKSC